MTPSKLHRPLESTPKGIWRLFSTCMATLAMIAVLSLPALAKGVLGPDKANDPELKKAFEIIAQKQQKIQDEKLAEITKNLSDLERQWGISFVGIHTTAAGYMLDMRFRVLDAEKAFPLLMRHVERYLVVEKSGAVLRIPFTAKLGSLRASVRTKNMVKANSIYTNIFANPGQHVKPGDKVSVVIGNFMAENVTVQ